MPKDWLILDMSSLAYRALHSTGGLSYGGNLTGVVFGVFRALAALREDMETHHVAYCFDYGKGLREQKFPWYKESRRTKKRTDEEEHERFEMKAQIDRMRSKYLPDLGLGDSVFFQEGYEADDVMASVAQNLPEGDRGIIVSQDHDFFQLLSSKVAQYMPTQKLFFTAKDFRERYKLAPNRWVEVKAIAGCTSDDVPGVDRVGEITAAQFLNGSGSGKKITPAILEHVASQQYLDNLEVVRLPYTGCKKFEVDPDAPTSPDPKAWKNLAESLGFASLTSAWDSDKSVRGPVCQPKGRSSSGRSAKTSPRGGLLIPNPT